MRRRRGSRRRAALSLARGDLLQLFAKLGEDLGAIHALGAGLLAPVLDDRGGPLLHLRDEGGVGVDDLDAGLLQHLQALPVGLVPRLPGVTRDPLAGDLVNRVLVLLRQLVHFSSFMKKPKAELYIPPGNSVACSSTVSSLNEMIDSIGKNTPSATPDFSSS